MSDVPILRFVVDAASHGLRIDTFLAARLRNHAAARLQRLAAAGLVRADDGPCPPDRRVFRGEEIAVRLAEPPHPFYEPEPRPLGILYQDAWLLAVNKPAGQVAHPAAGVEAGTVAHQVQGHLDAASVRPGLLRPGIVHRLDRHTSGVLLVATDAAAHAGLTAQFERAQVRKVYLAIVRGRMARDEGTIDLPIGEAPGSILSAVGPAAVGPRPAATAFRSLARLRTTTLVEARPRTGRKHQIRVHFAAVGHPIAGDEFYGPVMGSPGVRHSLHAAAIGFRHPITGAPMWIGAPVPSDFWTPLAATTAANAES